MLIGRGMIATSFADFGADDRATIFASGVSNSSEKDPERFARESDLLMTVVRKTPLTVYFSSLFDKRKALSAYASHKMDMESIVREQSENYLVLRLPQVVGPNNNRFNLVGFFADKLLSQQGFEVQADATRVLLDVCDLRTLSEYYISDPEQWNQTVQIAPPPAVPVRDIVAELEQLLQVKGRYTVAPGGDPFNDVSVDLSELAQRLGIGFGPDYCKQVLRKYYGRQ